MGNSRGGHIIIYREGKILGISIKKISRTALTGGPAEEMYNKYV